MLIREKIQYNQSRYSSVISLKPFQTINISQVLSFSFIQYCIDTIFSFQPTNILFKFFYKLQGLPCKGTMKREENVPKKKKWKPVTAGKHKS